MAPSTNGQATPSKERLPFPQSSNSSPLPLKHSASATSTSSSSNHLSTTSPTPVVTVEGLLKQFSSSPDPKSAALDHLVAERNSFSAQNVQLWKLIEKQRAGYSQILKELDRIRGERDGYKNKLAAVTGAPVEKPSRADRSTNPLSVSKPSTSRRQPSGDEGLTTPRNINPASLLPYQPPPSHSDSELQSNVARPETPPRPPPTSAPSAFSTPTASRTPARPAPSPLILPTRSESPAIPSSAISINVDNAPFSRKAQAHDDHSNIAGVSNGAREPVYPPRKSSLTDSGSLASIPSVAVSNGPGSANLATPTAHNYSTQLQAPTALSTQKEERTNGTAAHPFTETPNIRSPPTPTSTSKGPQPHSAALRANSLDIQPQNQQLLGVIQESRSYLSRDSRISLPDEARQYIANMADSPVPSPKVNNFASRSAAPNTETSSLAPDPDSKGEFLDFDEDDEDGDDDDDDEEGVENASPNNTAGASPQGPNTPTYSNFSRSTQSLDSPVDATPNRPRQEASRSGFDEFIFPPHSSRQQMLQVEDISSQAPQSAPGRDASPAKQLQSPDPFPSNSGHQPQDPGNSARGYNSSSKSSSAPHYDMKPTGSQTQQSPHAVSASFRALPLLSSDLPYTAIQVSHSFVRPNDRGKEVLSFIVSVNPGHGKPGWKVEKMYSDVISLDQRVRNSVGKGVVKKIASLPEGKLWRDHAPARVDQRKAILEQYLQSLIQLPVKSNDEVIAFFTSDIVRETKAPVMQVGHKEGYLTKRGKNFGGWKTRFFVLQGPVLEYYDCRGGQHLGSIQITGAQIARQHKTDKNPSGDEENEYRHAFLIVEAKKGPGGSHPRHVLCAESDEERDAWVELLVRYYTGTYNEDLIFNPTSGLNLAMTNSVAAAGNYQQVSSPMQSRTSTSSTDTPPPSASRKQPPRPAISLDDYTRSSSPSRSVDPSPIDRTGPPAAFHDAQMRRMASERSGLPSSLPEPSPLSSVPPIQLDANIVERAASELGHYPDHQVPNSAQPRQRSPERHRPREVYEGRHTNFSSTNLPSAQPDRAPSPEKPDLSKVKISGPMNGAVIPSGFKFGKEAPNEQPMSTAERREKAKSRSFWGFGKTNGAEKHPTNFVPRAVFAIPLEDSLEVAQICGLPAIVFRCIQYLEAKKADQEEGIYRLSGSSAVIKNLKDRFNSEGDVDLLASDEYWDPHAIAGLLKSFLRDLPSSILTREMHLRFLAVIDLLDAQERIRELSQLIAALPIANYTLLRALTAHLILIVQNAHVNKMTMRNVGIVFSPTLGIPAGVFSLMLGEFNRVFNVDMDDEAIAQGDPSASLSEPMRRNSKRYSDSAADKLLGLSGRTLKASAEETQSDGDEFSVNDESGTETTEGDVTVESSSSSPMHDSEPSTDVQGSPPDTPMAPKMSKASHVAASRGLNVTVAHSERGNRHSKLMGLPLSPRPPVSPSRPQET